MDLGLAGKRVVVTGATRGIGRSIAESFAREGCDVAICARTASDVESTITALRGYGVNAAGGVLDVGDYPACDKWIKEAAERLGGIDVLVSTVSAQSFSWEECFAIDIRATVQIVQSSLPYLQQSSGSIVAIASKAALLSVPSYKAYSAMKAALISYMSSLSRELAPQRIRVNVVSPGEINFLGGFWDRMRNEDPALYRKAIEKNPSGRMGTPDEVARAIVFLASPAASFISGTNLLIDYAGRDHVQF